MASQQRASYAKSTPLKLREPLWVFLWNRVKVSLMFRNNWFCIFETEQIFFLSSWTFIFSSERTLWGKLINTEWLHESHWMLSMKGIHVSCLCCILPTLHLSHHVHKEAVTLFSPPSVPPCLQYICRVELMVRYVDWWSIWPWKLQRVAC